MRLQRLAVGLLLCATGSTQAQAQKPIVYPAKGRPRPSKPSIAGTSMGSLVGAAYATGMAPMAQLVGGLSTEKLFKERAPRQESGDSPQARRPYQPVHPGNRGQREWLAAAKGHRVGDFRGDAFFNLNASYRRTWINSLGAEWRTDAQVGQTSRLVSAPYDFGADVTTIEMTSR